MTSLGHVPDEDPTLDHARAETMDKLVHALRGNVRVAYELELEDLLPAYVARHPFILTAAATPTSTHKQPFPA